MNEKTRVTGGDSIEGKEARERGYSLRPQVNIFEDADGITLEADMPGVDKDRLRLQVDKDALLIEGDIHCAMPEGMETLHADVRAMRFSRSFALSRELDTGSIDASLKDGVLKLRIPKRAEERPRRIEVSVG